ncbi:hypothetical protein KJN74_04730 [Candidatus Bathyarchaeota archaeon]|nr:hypothetical protein [Candidatus Bathyarchaeota archaeon]
MNGKTKTLSVIIIAIAICLVIYSPLTQATQAELSLGDELEISQIEESKPEGFQARPRVRFAVWFLKHAQPNEVEGKVVALVQKKLVINVEDELIRVNMPRQWVTNNEVFTLRELFENHLHGEELIIKVLEADMINKEGIRIYIFVGYELVTDSGFKATACLKMNIED